MSKEIRDSLSPEAQEALHTFENRDLELENIMGNLLIAQYQVDKLRSRLAERVGGYGSSGAKKASAVIFRHNDKNYALALKVLEDSTGTLARAVGSDVNIEKDIQNRLRQITNREQELTSLMTQYNKTKAEIEAPIKEHYTRIYQNYNKTVEEIRTELEASNEQILAEKKQEIENNKNWYNRQAKAYEDKVREVEDRIEQRIEEQKQSYLDSKKNYEEAREQLRVGEVELNKALANVKTAAVKKLQEKIKSLEKWRDNHDCEENCSLEHEPNCDRDHVTDSTHDECYDMDYINQNYYTNEAYEEMENKKNELQEVIDNLKSTLNDMKADVSNMRDERDQALREKRDIEAKLASTS